MKKSACFFVSFIIAKLSVRGERPHRIALSEFAKRSLCTVAAMRRCRSSTRQTPDLTQRSAPACTAGHIRHREPARSATFAKRIVLAPHGEAHAAQGAIARRDIAWRDDPVLSRSPRTRAYEAPGRSKPITAARSWKDLLQCSRPGLHTVCRKPSKTILYL